MEDNLSYPDLENIDRLPTHRFNFDNYCSKAGISPSTNWMFSKNRFLANCYGIKAKIVGWCDASNLEVRPRNNAIR